MVVVVVTTTMTELLGKKTENVKTYDLKSQLAIKIVSTYTWTGFQVLR